MKIRIQRYDPDHDAKPAPAIQPGPDIRRPRRARQQAGEDRRAIEHEYMPPVCISATTRPSASQRSRSLVQTGCTSPGSTASGAQASVRQRAWPASMPNCGCKVYGLPSVSNSIRLTVSR